MKEIEIRIDIKSVDFFRQPLALTQIIMSNELDTITPSRGPVDPFSIMDHQQRMERRRRFIDMLAANLAHKITEAIFKHGEDR